VVVLVIEVDRIEDRGPFQILEEPGERAVIAVGELGRGGRDGEIGRLPAGREAAIAALVIVEGQAELLEVVDALRVCEKSSA
jgi:hypothetical protein